MAVSIIISLRVCGAFLFLGRRWFDDLLSRVPHGESDMPSTINLHLIGVWFCVGFFTGAGWAVAAWLVGRILTAI